MSRATSFGNLLAPLTAQFDNTFRDKCQQSPASIRRNQSTQKTTQQVRTGAFHHPASSRAKEIPIKFHQDGKRRRESCDAEKLYAIPIEGGVVNFRRPRI
jgi:hypothetical protein